MNCLFDPRTNDVEDLDDDDDQTVDYDSELGDDYILDVVDPQHLNLELKHKLKKSHEKDEYDEADDTNSRIAHVLRLKKIKNIKKNIDSQIEKMEIVKGDKID